MREQILLIGAGGHALSCIDVIEQANIYKIAGFVGLPHEIGNEICGYHVLGCDHDLPQLLKTYKNALIAVGQIKTPRHRIKLFELIMREGAQVPVIISPNAYVSSRAKLGVGTIVMHGAIINANVSVGENCIINSKVLVEHGVTVGEHCHLSTSCVINGDVKIGSGTFIGSGSCVRQSLSISDNCVIGMGKIILKDYSEMSN